MASPTTLIPNIASFAATSPLNLSTSAPTTLPPSLFLSSQTPSINSKENSQHGAPASKNGLVSQQSPQPQSLPLQMKSLEQIEETPYPEPRQWTVESETIEQIRQSLTIAKKRYIATLLRTLK